MKKVIFLILTMTMFVINSQAQDDLSQPRFIFGKPFIESFQAMYKTNNIDMMIMFTSSKSIEKFGDKAIRKYYSDYIKFSYPLEFRNATVSKDGVYNFNYFVKVDYTEKKPVTFHIIVENDTSKIVLDNLSFNFVDLNNVSE